MRRRSTVLKLNCDNRTTELPKTVQIRNVRIVANSDSVCVQNVNAGNGHAISEARLSDGQTVQIGSGVCAVIVNVESVDVDGKTITIEILHAKTKVAHASHFWRWAKITRKTQFLPLT
jgi:hypothetical protein